MLRRGAEPPAARLRFRSLLGMSELNEGVLVRRPTLSCHRVAAHSFHTWHVEPGTVPGRSFAYPGMAPGHKP